MKTPYNFPPVLSQAEIDEAKQLKPATLLKRIEKLEKEIKRMKKMK